MSCFLKEGEVAIAVLFWGRCIKEGDFYQSVVRARP